MSKQPDPRQLELANEVARLRKDLDELRLRSPFYSTGIHPNGHGGLDSDNFATGVSGYSFQGDTGNAEFNDLTLRGGIIGDDALTNPVRGDVTTAYGAGFAIPTVGTFTTLASVTWAVPAGFNQAQIYGNAKVFAVNNTGGLDYLYARSRIVRVSDGAELTGLATPTATSSAGGSGTSIGLGVGVIGLSGAGDQVRLEVQCSTAFGAWAADPSNTAEWSGAINWYRV